MITKFYEKLRDIPHLNILCTMCQDGGKFVFDLKKSPCYNFSYQDYGAAGGFSKR